MSDEKAAKPVQQQPHAHLIQHIREKEAQLYAITLAREEKTSGTSKEWLNLKLFEIKLKQLEADTRILREHYIDGLGVTEDTAGLEWLLDKLREETEEVLKEQATGTEQPGEEFQQLVQSFTDKILASSKESSESVDTSSQADSRSPQSPHTATKAHIQNAHEKMTAALALVTAPQAPSLTKQAILAAFDTTKSQMDDLLAAIQTLDVEHKGCNCGEIAIGQLEIDMVEVREKRNIVEVVYDWLLACTVDCDPSTPLFFPALDFLTMMTIAEPRSAYDAQEAPKVKMMLNSLAESFFNFIQNQLGPRPSPQTSNKLQ